MGKKGTGSKIILDLVGFMQSLFCLLLMNFFMQQALHCCLVNCLHLLLYEAVY